MSISGRRNEFKHEWVIGLNDLWNPFKLRISDSSDWFSAIGWEPVGEVEKVSGLFWARSDGDSRNNRVRKRSTEKESGWLSNLTGIKLQQKDRKEGAGGKVYLEKKTN